MLVCSRSSLLSPTLSKTHSHRFAFNSTDAETEAAPPTPLAHSIPPLCIIFIYFILFFSPTQFVQNHCAFIKSAYQFHKFIQFVVVSFSLHIHFECHINMRVKHRGSGSFFIFIIINVSLEYKKKVFFDVPFVLKLFLCIKLTDRRKRSQRSGTENEKNL